MQKHGSKGGSSGGSSRMQLIRFPGWARWACGAACLLIASGPVNTSWVARAQAQTPAGATAASGDAITLNFKDAEIDSVVGAFGHLLNRTFIIDPRVRGKITLETPRPVTKAKAYELLQAVLRVQGFAVVESGSLAKIVPEADAKLQSGPVTAGRNAPGSSPSANPGGDQVVTQIFRLQYESASNVVPVLRPLISPNNTITAYPNNNSLVITDYAANLQRIARIISTLDSPSTNEVEVVPIKHALASDIAVSVLRMLDDSARAGAGAQVDPGQRVAILADPRLNAVIVRAASAAKINLAKTLIMRLDQPSTSPGNIHVVYLRNAEAVRLAQVLRGVLSGDSAGSSSSVGGAAQSGFGSGNLPGMNTSQGLSGSPNPVGGLGGAQTGGAGASASAAPLQSSSAQPVTVNAGGAIIAADPSTNSLIITAPEPIYRNLRNVIDRLDARRAQVYIESLIVEVSAERAAELGIQWQALSGSALSSGRNSVFGGTNLPARGAGNILDATTNPLNVNQGLNLGIIRGTINIAGTTIFNVGMLARALETQANANILATPNLLTLDNEEARIIIGQNVPFVTGQFTGATTGGAVNPFQTIERRDVGTTLRVRPQVSEGGTVRMQIFQEVSSVQDRTLSAGLITNRRAIESNVLVDDGQIVVLGGLIEERIEGDRNSVPGLSEIPIVGNLFRYDARKRIKTNLLVFLRPVVIRDAASASSVTADRYDYVRQLQGDSRMPQHWLLPDFPPSQIPPMPALPPGIAPAAPVNPASMNPDVNAATRRSAPIEASPGLPGLPPKPQ